MIPESEDARRRLLEQLEREEELIKRRARAQREDEELQEKKHIWRKNPEQ